MKLHAIPEVRRLYEGEGAQHDEAHALLKPLFENPNDARAREVMLKDESAYKVSVLATAVCSAVEGLPINERKKYADAKGSALAEFNDFRSLARQLANHRRQFEHARSSGSKQSFLSFMPPEGALVLRSSRSVGGINWKSAASVNAAYSRLLRERFEKAAGYLAANLKPVDFVPESKPEAVEKSAIRLAELEAALEKARSGGERGLSAFVRRIQGPKYARLRTHLKERQDELGMVARAVSHNKALNLKVTRETLSELVLAPEIHFKAFYALAKMSKDKRILGYAEKIRRLRLRQEGRPILPETVSSRDLNKWKMLAAALPSDHPALHPLLQEIVQRIPDK